MTPVLFVLALATATPDPCPSEALPADGWIEFADSEVLQCIAAPDGMKGVVVRRGEVRLISGGATYLVGAMDGGHIVWSLKSDGFAIADQMGSGQTEQFSYVDATVGAPHASRTLAEAGIARFKARLRCQGAAVYVDTFTDGWLARGQVRLVIQDGVHSEGCGTRGELIGVLGDPRTGRIERVLSHAEVLREWCTAAQRREYGYCYDEAEAGRR